MPNSNIGLVLQRYCMWNKYFKGNNSFMILPNWMFPLTRWIYAISSEKIYLIWAKISFDNINLIFGNIANNAANRLKSLLYYFSIDCVCMQYFGDKYQFSWEKSNNLEKLWCMFKFYWYQCFKWSHSFLEFWRTTFEPILIISPFN